MRRRAATLTHCGCGSMPGLMGGALRGDWRQYVSSADRRRNEVRPMRDIRDAQRVGRTSDGRLVARPLSGHLSVYINFDMVMSVGHRVTGCAIAVGTIVMVWFLVAAGGFVRRRVARPRS